MSGKPRFIPEARTKSYMIVHPKVVRETGSARNALVLIRMEWRCEEITPSTREVDGRIWWAATAAEIAAETGLDVGPVRDALKQLRDDGWVDELDRGRGNAKWYAPADRANQGVSGNPDTPVSGNPEGVSGNPDGGVSGNPDSLLLIELEASGGENIVTSAVGFERAWKSWPTARRGARKKAEASWRTAVQSVGSAQLERLVVRAEETGAVYATWAPAEQQFVPHLVTWLNQERWTMPLPEADRGRARTTVETGRAAADILAQRRQQAAGVEQKAISA